MAVAGFYRRLLPCPPAVEFASREGKGIFAEALSDGTMEGFFKLISYFQTQAEPAYCGLASLSVVLNALSIDPGRTWKGPWRWFDESMLDCCESLEKVKREGITFGKVACLVKCSGASVQTFRASQSTLEEFRHHVKQCASSEARHVITSYYREPLKQTGGGHFSPIGGYHSGRDMALILDVARFKYPPHWVPLPLLWDAINTVDESTGLTRGYMVVSNQEYKSSLLFTLSCKDEHWRSISHYLFDEVPQLLRSTQINNVEKAFEIVLGSLPGNVATFVNWIAEVRKDNGKVENDEVERLKAKANILQQLRTTEVYRIVAKWVDSNSINCPLVSHAEENLQEAVAGACCQGAVVLSGLHVSNISLSKKDIVATVTTQNNLSCTIVSSNVKMDGADNSIDLLIPAVEVERDISISKCKHLHPASKDLLAILILALPPATFGEICDLDVQRKAYDLVSSSRLPSGLQEEVLHLREQFRMVNKCDNGSVEGDKELSQD